MKESPKGSSTPMYVALKGTYDWVVPYATSSGYDKTVVVLVSDGSPSTCDSNDGEASSFYNLVSQAAQKNVLTAAIGIGSANVSILDTIAFAGGTSSSSDITGNVHLLTQQFQQIRNSFQCSYRFNHYNFDPNQWYVEYISSNGFPDWLLPRLESQVECEKNHGWYYDNNDNPTELTLCPKACEILNFDDNFTLRFAFGCLGEEVVK